MKNSAVIMLTFVISVIASPSGSVAGERSLTPYGDSCKECGTYGVCEEAFSPEQAIIALEEYYKVKGLRVGTVLQKGRFIQAEILKGNSVIDRVLLDRKTGRLRSMY